MLSPDAPVTPAGTETVERPPPGLARGRWEAPAWAFDAVAVAAILALAAALVGSALAWAARRTRLRAQAASRGRASLPPRVRARS